MSRLPRVLPLPYLVTILLSLSSTELGATERVVRNTDETLPKKGATLTLTSNLVLGKEDGDEGELFGRIGDVAVDSKHHIYVIDLGYQRVRKFDKAGRFVETVGHEGEGPSEYFDPFAVTTDAQDNVLIASRAKVSVFNSEGEYLREFRHGLSGAIRRIRMTSEQEVVLSCFEVFEQKILHRFDPEDGSRLSSFCDSYAVGQEIDTRVEQVTAGGTIDVSKNGRIYFTQMTPYEIREFSSNGELLTTVHRENNFITPMEVERLSSGTISFKAFPNSVSIVTIPGAKLLNVAIVPIKPGQWETVFDVFDEAGTLLATKRVPHGINVKCSSDDQLYAVEQEDYPKVVRYWVRFEQEMK